MRQSTCVCVFLFSYSPQPNNIDHQDRGIAAQASCVEYRIKHVSVHFSVCCVACVDIPLMESTSMHTSEFGEK